MKFGVGFGVGAGLVPAQFRATTRVRPYDVGLILQFQPVGAGGAFNFEGDV